MSDLKAAAEAATPGPWKHIPWHIEEGPPAVRCDDGNGHVVATTASEEDAAFIAAARNLVLALYAELDEAREQVNGLRLSQSFDKDSAYVIRELLNRHNVPAAAFIDDHVANAIAQRDAAEASLASYKEEVERLLAAMDREEAYLHRMIDASEENGGIMHGDLEGAFHRIRDKDSDDAEAAEAALARIEETTDGRA